jgi:hypothetical protein
MGMITEDDDVDPFGNEVNKMRELLRRDNIHQTDGIADSGQHVYEMELGSSTPNYPLGGKARSGTVKLNANLSTKNHSIENSPVKNRRTTFMSGNTGLGGF